MFRICLFAKFVSGSHHRAVEPDGELWVAGWCCTPSLPSRCPQTCWGGEAGVQVLDCSLGSVFAAPAPGALAPEGLSPITRAALGQAPHRNPYMDHASWDHTRHLESLGAHPAVQWMFPSLPWCHFFPRSTGENTLLNDFIFSLPWFHFVSFPFCQNMFPTDGKYLHLNCRVAQLYFDKFIADLKMLKSMLGCVSAFPLSLIFGTDPCSGWLFQGESHSRKVLNHALYHCWQLGLISKK